MKHCMHDGCCANVLARGYCTKHYKRLIRHGSPDSFKFQKAVLKERFFSRLVAKSDEECWPWPGAVNNSGYGVIYDGKRLVLAHRVSYEQHVGEIPDGKYILHSCDFGRCVNPRHLRAGTQSENMRDAYLRGRR